MTRIEKALKELGKLLHAHCKNTDCDHCDVQNVCEFYMEFIGDAVPSGMAWWLQESEESK